MGRGEAAVEEEADAKADEKVVEEEANAEEAKVAVEEEVLKEALEGEAQAWEVRCQRQQRMRSRPSTRRRLRRRTRPITRRGRPKRGGGRW